jgi:hypothetical protein
MKTFLILSFCYLFAFLSNAQTNIPSGDVSGTWTKANSPYNVLGEITIPNDSTLTIEPGVDIIFKGHYKFNVKGRLLAIGTSQDTIRFTAENKVSGWHGVRFFNTPNTNDSSKIIYCSFKYGNANTGSGYDRCGGAMLIKDFDKVLVSNCLIDSNKQSGDGWDPPEAIGGIYVYHASPLITNNTLSNNHSVSKSSAIACVNCPNAIVSKNIVINNIGRFAAVVFASGSKGILSDNIIANNYASYSSGGILFDCALVSGSVTPLVMNNIIVHNQGYGGGGINCYVRAHPILINNTIAYNNSEWGGGIYFDGNSDGIFINNILFGNTANSSGNQVFIKDNESDPIFLYCDIQGGKESFAGPGSGANYRGHYDNNIDSDPLFIDTLLSDYGLSEISQCIGAGGDSVEIQGTWYKAPTLCINGNPRPSPIGSMPDIGACESPFGTPLVGVENIVFSIEEFTLEQNYPNPFNPTTVIKYQIPKQSFVTLKFFDVLGNEIETLVNEEKPIGSHEVVFEGKNLPSGIYFYRLQTEEFIETKKMILLK